MHFIVGLDPGISETAISVICFDGDFIRVMDSVRINVSKTKTNTRRLQDLYTEVKTHLGDFRDTYPIDFIGIEVPSYISLDKARITRDLTQRDVTMVCRLAIAEWFDTHKIYNEYTNTFVAPISVHAVPHKLFMKDEKDKKERLKQWILANTHITNKEELVSKDQFDSVGIAIVVYKALKLDKQK